MTCPKCGSPNVTTQIVTDMKLKDKHHGILWWLFVGWWWLLFKWLFLTIPALIVKIFGHKKQKLVTKQRTMCVCQNCGYGSSSTWIGRLLPRMDAHLSGGCPVLILGIKKSCIEGY